MWREHFKIPLCDSRARSVTYAQARLDLELSWSLANGGDEQPAGDGFASNEEWFDAQLEEMRAEKERIAREGPAPQTPYMKRLFEELNKLPDGNLDPAAAMKRLKLLTEGLPPREDEKFEVVSLTDDGEV